MDAVLDAIFSGNKVLAVKLYKEATGASLYDAKEFVEDLTDKLREEQGDQFVVDEQKGCLVLTTGGMLMAILAGYFFWAH